MADVATTETSLSLVDAAAPAGVVKVEQSASVDQPANVGGEHEEKEKEEEDGHGTGLADLNKYEFKITMSCGGCSGAVTRVLTKLEAEGVNKFEVSLDKQDATVYADKSLAYETVLAKIQNTGKKVTAGFENGEERSVEKKEAA